MSGLHWYSPRPLSGDPATILEGLRQLGVVFEVSDEGPIYVVQHDRGQEILMKSIGCVMVYADGEVVCRFRDPLTARDIRVLLGSVEGVLLGEDPPTSRTWWRQNTHKGRRRWVSTVQVPVTEQEDTMVARILRDAERNQDDSVEAVSRLLETADQQGGA